MANFIGAKCEYCKKIFTEEDDIVVCPECGTPYHRECYFEAGECINKELHERGGEWSQFYSDRADFSADASENKEAGGSRSDNKIRCPRCGQENPDSGLFCITCGTPLIKNQEPNPFNGANRNFNQQQFPFGNMYGNPAPQVQTVDIKNEEIAGHKSKKYAQFTKKSYAYYVTNFFFISKKNSKLSLNFFALLFPEYFFFYRKMYGVGAIALILSSVLKVPGMIMFILDGLFPSISLPQFFSDHIKAIETVNMYASVLSLALAVILGLFANYFYFRKAKKTLDEIEGMDITEEEKDRLIDEKGGTSVLALIAGITTNVILVMLMIIALVLLFK